VAQSSKHLDVFLALRQELVNYASKITGDRIQAEDIVQEAYIRFVPNEPDPTTTITQPAAYLYRIVRNLALDLKRSRLREQAHQSMPPAWLLYDEASDPADECQQSMTLERLASVLEKMPEASRLALEMHRFSGCTLAQIAERLGVSLTSAHRLLRDALVRLAVAMEEPDAAPNLRSKPRG
jgi:RNA polymerase sigma-70 factor (ECF subfamily)